MQNNQYQERKFNVSVLFLGLFILITNLFSCIRQDRKIVDKIAERNKKTVLMKFEEWSKNQGSIFDLLQQQVIWTVTGGAPYSGSYQGKEDFIKNAVIPITQMLKSSIKPELISITAEDDIVWLNWKGKTQTNQGNTYKNNYAWMMKMRQDSIIEVMAFLDTYELNKLKTMNSNKTVEETKEYIGMWVTENGYIRHELLPNNRYDEARANRQSAYQGSYKITGNHIDYKDDTGFVADGEFKDGILYHAGMILKKQ